MMKLIRNSFILLIFIIAVVYMQYYLLPVMPKNFNECISSGGIPKKVVTENGVIDDPDQCVFAAKNSKQERECIRIGGENRIGGKCPCCELTYQK